MCFLVLHGSVQQIAMAFIDCQHSTKFIAIYSSNCMYFDQFPCGFRCMNFKYGVELPLGSWDCGKPGPAEPDAELMSLEAMVRSNASAAHLQRTLCMHMHAYAHYAKPQPLIACSEEEGFRRHVHCENLAHDNSSSELDRQSEACDASPSC